MSYNNWIYTLNTDVILEAVPVQPYTELGPLELAEGGHVLQHVHQLERCPSTGRVHYQGYVRFDIKCRIRRAKAIMGSDTIHLERRKGTHEQAKEYCTKVGSRIAGPWLSGVDPQGGGKRSDLAEVTAALYLGTPLRTIMHDEPQLYCQYRQGLRDIAADSLRTRARDWRALEVIVNWGDAGTGKTRAAVERGGDDYFILDHSERVWFDGYAGEKTLIIDDFYGWIKYHYLLRILDGYELRLEIKGGFTYAFWTTVIITSNKEPKDWYPVIFGDNRVSGALSRRITTINHFVI